MIYNLSFTANPLWAMIPVYYFVSMLIYLVVFVYFTRKILDNENILSDKKVKYIVLLSCYFYFPMFIYLLMSSFSFVFLLYYLVISVCAIAYLIYAVKRIVYDEYFDNNKKTLYILAASLIWVFGFFLYVSQARAIRLKTKYKIK
jgi:hypothetical protein